MFVAPAPYLPFLDPHKGKAPGLWALDPATWVEIDAAYARQMAYRDRLIAENGAAVARAEPGADAILEEFWAVLVAHLAERYPDAFEIGPDHITRADGVRAPRDGSIAALGRLVQEDWCLLDGPDRNDGEYVLIAANLCFPSRWKLADKIGRPLTGVHHGVPHYEEHLKKRINRVFAALAVERPLQRLNTMVHPDPELFQPGVDRPASLSALFHLRVERQTLRRLPQTRGIVFGIKTYITPITALPPEARLKLADHLDVATPEEREHKGGADLIAAAQTALRAG